MEQYFYAYLNDMVLGVGETRSAARDDAIETYRREATDNEWPNFEDEQALIDALDIEHVA